MLRNLLKNLVSSKPAGSGGEAVSSAQVQAQQEFSHLLLGDFYRLAHQYPADNYDHHRYSFDGSDNSKDIDLDPHVAYLHLYFDRAKDFYKVYSLFKDDASRELFRRLVLYRMLGHVHVRIFPELGGSTEAALLEQAKQFDVGPSSLSIIGAFGPLRRHAGIPVPNAAPIALDCWASNVSYAALKRQYFFSRNGVVIAPEPDDVAIDAGSCLGDTAVYFAAVVGESGHVHSFDPLPAHNEVVDFNVRQNQFERRVTSVPYAVGETLVSPSRLSSEITSDRAARPGFSMLSGDHGFAVTTLDAYAQERSLSKIDFIKMDIEGYEMPALRGAKQIISRFAPKLAISLYHKPADLIDIPIWIADNFPGYDFYLDHYTIHQEETVLYAVAR